jgi:predicted AlkP superfamily pyrophosphatase or phosphodiesterase
MWSFRGVMTHPRQKHYRLLAVGLSLAGACASPPPLAHRSGGPKLGRSVHPTARNARLVVVVVIDQLGSRTLEQFFPELDPNGALHMARRRGVYHRHVRYPYANTLTGPGHATLFTGAAPADNCVVSNKSWDPNRQKKVDTTDDGIHAVHGHAETFASPAVLCAPAVGDALHDATQGRARVVTLSMKDRAAVFPGGQHPDLALWYDDDIPAFTTSTYYATVLPPWLLAWHRRHPFADLLRPWRPLHAARYAALLGPDSGPGEGNWHGFGTTFPHDPSSCERPYETVLATPQSSEALLSLARVAVEELHLGEDEFPDLLAVSISGTDYVGHIFGPDSWEYLDNLIRVDRALGALLLQLEAKTELSVLITSDHGHAPLPERIPGGGGRLNEHVLATELNDELVRALGPGRWVEGYLTPYIYFSAETRSEPQRRARAVAAAQEYLRRRSGVAVAIDAREAATWRDSSDPLRASIALGITPEPAGDLVLYPAQGWVLDSLDLHGAGTTHGSPWEYDRNVPVLFYGPGVTRQEVTEVGDARQVAPTIAAMLGVGPPGKAKADPLKGSPLDPFHREVVRAGKK